ncbi:hypothetical protein CFIMG_002324RA [Ceratocystis fimbriata CBS 114723]|uniref:Uncharacterized protein n=1 Tax=Ceratocystis fimbriata CBS 114723 TaxID=1035309 RepID=A0A2C5X3N7_9PEZI|nr:hypothetical protein CFIMG_002324RA [Ceratocystis fimbriata CBS 114723]
MLEYFAFQKFKKAKADKAAKEAAAAGTAKESSEAGLVADVGDGAGIEAVDGNATGKAPAVTSTDEANITTILEATQKTTNDKHMEQSNSGDLTLVLRKDDENFFRSIIDWDALLSGSNDDEASRPPLPPRPSDKGDQASIKSVESTNSTKDPGANKEKDTEGGGNKDKEKGKERSAPGRINRLSAFLRRDHSKSNSDTSTPVAVPETSTEVSPLDTEVSAPAEAQSQVQSEAKELAHVLDELDLSARNNRTFSMSAESAALVHKFSLVLQDLLNGVPTAVDDIKALVEDRDGTLARSYDRLPSPLKKLVASMPAKVTDKLGPEVAVAAAKSQGVALEAVEGAAGKTVVKEAAKKIFTSLSLTELVTNPAIIVDMLKAIMGALKTRWPAFIGTNAVLSVALFLLLFVLWYCHKRGREVRLEKEEVARSEVDAEGDVEITAKTQSESEAKMEAETETAKAETEART